MNESRPKVTLAQMRADREQRAQRMAKMVEDGMSKSEIARLEGVTRERVGQLVGMIVPRGTKRPPPVTPERLTELVRMAGDSVLSLAPLLGYRSSKALHQAMDGRQKLTADKTEWLERYAKFQSRYARARAKLFSQRVPPLETGLSGERIQDLVKQTGLSWNRVGVLLGYSSGSALRQAAAAAAAIPPDKSAMLEKFAAFQVQYFADRAAFMAEYPPPGVGADGDIPP